ncbi:unnamed protein product [Cyclocybe aegerita]|uniref:Uncharacterized protein n=1 Tax=Cyclocybe aegerita TaxID=1973307 RepID=A0A8S0WIR1_CYCAE|nr:unnamed protein product [Cyclocybe aegerita]
MRVAKNGPGGVGHNSKHRAGAYRATATREEGSSHCPLIFVRPWSADSPLMTDVSQQEGPSPANTSNFATIDLADYNEFTKTTLKSTSETMVEFRKREGKQPCDLCVRNGEECVPVDPGRGIRCALCSKRRKVCSWRADILIPATATHYGLSAEDATKLYDKWVELQSKPPEKARDKPEGSSPEKVADMSAPSTPVASITAKKPVFARKEFKARRPGEFIFQLGSPSTQPGADSQTRTASTQIPVAATTTANPSLRNLTGATTTLSSNPVPKGKGTTQTAQRSEQHKKASTVSPKIHLARRNGTAVGSPSTRRKSEPPPAPAMPSTSATTDLETPKRTRRLTQKAQATLENQKLLKKNAVLAKRKREETEAETELPKEVVEETPQAAPEPPRRARGRPPKHRKGQAAKEPVKVKKVTVKVTRASKRRKIIEEDTHPDVEMDDATTSSSTRQPILGGEGAKLPDDLQEKYAALEERYLKLCDVFAQGAIEAKAKDDRVQQLEEANQDLERKLQETAERLAQVEEAKAA